MAFINIDNIKKLEKEKNSIHKDVDATYSVFTSGKTDEKYLQIDTYGSSDRQIKGKISQSIQLNQQTAKILVEILKREFNI